MSLRNTNMVHKYDKAFYELKINLAGLLGLQSVYLDHLKLKHPVWNNAKQNHYRELFVRRNLQFGFQFRSKGRKHKVIRAIQCR